MANALLEELARQEDEQIRSNIRRIISSYRHVWDIYTELLQNSADALIAKFSEESSDLGKIKLIVNTNKQEIRIIDNGIGISESSISKILVTGKSLKREAGNGRHGFMGFGFTYVAFQSCFLQISSAHNGLRASRTYKDLFKYVFDNKEIPNSEEENNGIEAIVTDDENQTEILVRFPTETGDEAVDISISAAFQIAKNPQRFAAMLRTKTIVGSLDPLFGEKPPFTFELEIDDVPLEVPVGYLSIREVVKSVVGAETQFHEMSHFMKMEAALATLPQQQKDQALKSLLIQELIENASIGARAPIVARALLIATSKFHLNTFNERLDQNDPTDGFSIEHGLWLSINGMPTGICLDAFDEHSNMLPYTVLIDILSGEVKQELDAGRKGISQYRAGQIRNFAKNCLRDRGFFTHRRYVVGAADSRISNPLYDPKSELKTLLNSKQYLNVPLSQQYFPPREEQEVISLFVELCARLYLRGYQQKVLSGFQVYDGLYNYSLEKKEGLFDGKSNKLGIFESIFDSVGAPLTKEIFIEFKLDIYGLYRDLGRNKKSLADIDILICWDVDFDVAKQRLLQEKGDVLGLVDKTRNVFHGVTHQMATSARPTALPIIELKTVIFELFNAQLSQK